MAHCSRVDGRFLERADGLVPQGVVPRPAERRRDAVADEPAAVDALVGDVVVAHQAAEVAEAVAYWERSEELEVHPARRPVAVQRDLRHVQQVDAVKGRFGAELRQCRTALDKWNLTT